MTSVRSIICYVHVVQCARRGCQHYPPTLTISLILVFSNSYIGHMDGRTIWKYSSTKCSCIIVSYCDIIQYRTIHSKNAQTSTIMWMISFYYNVLYNWIRRNDRLTIFWTKIEHVVGAQKKTSATSTTMTFRISTGQCQISYFYIINLFDDHDSSFIACICICV